MGILLWVVTNWRIILYAILLGGSFAIGWMDGKDHVQRQWDVDIHIRTKAVLEQVKANDEMKTKLEETKNENIKTIDMLAASNRELNKRLRLPKTTCTGRLPDTATSSGSENETAGNRELSEKIQLGAEESINIFDGAYASEAERADKLIENCRVIVDWANGR